MNDKAEGALFGLAVGDALGSTLEFSDPDEYPDFPTLMTGPLTEMVGQGPFHLQPGQVTDDTMMALCLSSSLVANNKLDLTDVRARYRNWVGLTHDAGRLTKLALKTSGEAAWEKSGRTSSGNGSLMRCTPIGVFFYLEPKALISASIWDSCLTHMDPRCALACAAHNSAIAEAVLLPTVTAENMYKAAKHGLAQGAARYKRVFPEYELELKAAVRDLTEDLKMAAETDPLLYDFSAKFSASDLTEAFSEEMDNVPGLAITGSGMGFVRVAFRLAFWELLHAHSFEAGLLDVVNRGGDSDTNGAIAGSLLGSLYGYSAIPPRWIQTVLECRPGGPFDTIYHPKEFINLLNLL